jgi:hypothetical protein
MKMSYLAVSAALAAFALPGAAFAQGKGHAAGTMSSHANVHATGTVGTGHAKVDSRANVRATTRTGTSVTRTTNHVTTRTTAANRWNGYACAPGLAGKTPACVPPGQLKRSYRVGQRLPDNYRYYTDLNGIPVQYRTSIPTTYQTGYRYIYQPNNTIYVVDPATDLIRSVINLVH